MPGGWKRLTASGTDPFAQTLMVHDAHSEPIPRSGAVQIVKDGSLDDGGNGVNPGDVMNYTFEVSNTGNVTLTSVAVTDPLVPACDKVIGPLAAGASDTYTCTATNVVVAGHEVDFYWPAVRLVVEVDGYANHGNRRSFEHDHRRDGDLAANGLRVLRVTWLQLTTEPKRTLVRIALALGRPG